MTPVVIIIGIDDGVVGSSYRSRITKDDDHRCDDKLMRTRAVREKSGQEVNKSLEIPYAAPLTSNDVQKKRKVERDDDDE